MKKTVIVDLDNCISDDRNRIPLIDWSKKGAARYKAYHSACGQDTCVVHEGISKALNLADRVVVITARPEAHRLETLSWLHKNGLRASVLLMREDGDERSSVDVKKSHLDSFPAYGLSKEDVLIAFDDRSEILEMYRSMGIPVCRVAIHKEDAYKRAGTAESLERMAVTFRARNGEYKDNYKVAGAMLAAMFPDGMPKDHEVGHLLSLIVVKLSRFAASGMTHRDSVHDAGVYSAMIDSILENREQRKEEK